MHDDNTDKSKKNNDNDEIHSEEDEIHTEFFMILEREY